LCEDLLAVILFYLILNHYLFIICLNDVEGRLSCINMVDWEEESREEWNG